MSFVVEIPSVFTKPTQIPVRLGNTILTGNETIQGSLSVNGSLILNSGVNQNNTNVIYYDSLDISNNLNVGGDVSISGDLVIGDVSASNISATNISATSITAPDVQPTLTAGTNITISGNTISAVAATPDLTDISNTNLSSVNISAINISCNKLTTSDATGSTSIISGVKINRDSSELVTFQAPDDKLMFAYNTTNGVNAILSENRLDLRVSSITKLNATSSGVRIGNDNTATEMLDVVGNAKISGNINASDISATNIDLTGNLTNNDILLNFKIDIPVANLSSGAVFLICLDDGGDNECTGKFYYNRNSGHDGSGFVDIVVSSRSVSGDTPHGFCSYQTAQETTNSNTPHRFSLITGTFSGVSYVGLKYEGGNAYPFGDAYFDGLWKSTGTNTPFELKLSSGVTSQTALPISYSEVSLQNKRLVIDTDGDVTIAGNLAAINLSCTELTTSDATGSTSVISGLKINKLNNNVARLLADDDTPLLSYNTGTGICAYQGENQVEFRVNGNPLLTCKSAGVRIGDNNTPTEILDVNGNALISGELTASLINSHQNWMRFGSPGSTVFTTGTTFYDLRYTSTSSDARKTNTSLITQNANEDEFTIVKAGYYRFFSQCGVYNNTYTDRITWRIQPVVNGSQSNNYSHLFCYTRHNQYGNRGTVNGEVLRLFAVGDTVRMRLDVGKASFGSNFGSDMGGIAINGGAYIEINYLGN